MDSVTLALIAFGLSMDAFAVAISNGAVNQARRFPLVLKMSVCFGVFQSGMLLLGSIAGRMISSAVTTVAYWVAFFVLVSIGANMIWSGCKNDTPAVKKDRITFLTLLVLALATSMDALAVGVSLSFMGADFVFPVVVVGLVTFSFSAVGVYAGRYLGSLFGKRAGLVGGVILVAIGIKILMENIFLYF